MILHSPDGTELLVLSEQLTVREINPHQQDHVVKGTNSVIYLGVRPNGFGVKETTVEVRKMVKDCETGGVLK
jgi:hypothetical protein